MEVNIDIIVQLVRSIFVVKDRNSVDDLCQQILASKPQTIVSFINAHALNLAWKNEAFANSLMSSQFLLRDGVGMDILFKTLNVDAGINMNGTDFIPIFLERNVGKRIALIGTKNPFLNNAVELLSNKGHNIVASMNGFSTFEDYLHLINHSKAEIVIMGMGMPKQEVFSRQLQNLIEHKCVLINGGAIIDFLGGKIDRAPVLLQKLGLEWVFRLMNEPKRLFNRYVIGNAIFLKRLPAIRTKFNITE